MSLFHFGINGEKITDGWLRQLWRSANGGDNFLLNAGLFGNETVKEMQEYKLHTKLFRENDGFDDNKFKAGKLFEGDYKDMYDKFITNFIATKDPDNITNKCEKLIKRTYDTLCQLYNF